MNKLRNLLFLALCAVASIAGAEEKTTVLAFGDSITGRSDSYRSILVPELRKRKVSVEFIGPLRDAVSAHAGYGGKNTAYLRSISSKVYAQHAADVVLLHSGHNSFSKDEPVAGIIRDTETIIKNIREINPEVKILLAQVIPAGKLPKYSYIPELNKELASLAQRLNREGAQVILVDQAEGFDWSADAVGDKVHPNASGARKMADKWLEALKPLLEKREVGC